MHNDAAAEGAFGVVFLAHDRATIVINRGLGLGLECVDLGPRALVHGAPRKRGAQHSGVATPMAFLVFSVYGLNRLAGFSATLRAAIDFADNALT